MANRIPFEELQTQMFDLYLAHDLAGALEAAESASGLYPDKSTKTAYWKACILSLMGRPEEAVSALAQGLADGAWWAPAMLSQDADLEAARTLPQMAEVLAETDRRRRAAQAHAKLELFTLAPRSRSDGLTGHDGAPPPLMLALHWRNGSGPEFIELFRPAADDLGFLLASAQSSQMCAKGQYCWDDQALGEAEVAQALAGLRASHRFDADKVVLAGASQGGRLAITMSLALPLCGFIVVVPAIRSVEQFTPYIRSAVERGMKGYIITGERDHFLSGAKDLKRLLDSNGIPCRMEVVPRMSHTFPRDFPEYLARAARFVMD